MKKIECGKLFEIKRADWTNKRLSLKTIHFHLPKIKTMCPQRALHEMNMTQDLQEENYQYHNTET